MSKFTARHYTEIAALLGTVAGRHAPSWLKPGALGPVPLARAEVMDAVFFGIKRMFEADNPSFNDEKFMKATVRAYEVTLAEIIQAEQEARTA